jgi:hypothetical protein
MTTSTEENLAFVAQRKHPVMLRQITRRPNNFVPRFDAVEILMFTAGVLFVVAIAFVF